MPLWDSVQHAFAKVREASKTPVGLTVRTTILAAGAALIAKDVMDQRKEQRTPGAGESASSRERS